MNIPSEIITIEVDSILDLRLIVDVLARASEDELADVAFNVTVGENLVFRSDAG